MSNTYGDKIKLSIFGSSHGPNIGMTLSGVPAGLKVDAQKLQSFLDRRAPGQNSLSTERKEADIPVISSGIENGITNGEPITAVIENTDIRKADYDSLKDLPRPGHADYTAHIKYGKDRDVTGGGQFSGRMTAAMCIAGGLCLQWLNKLGIRIGSHIVSIGNEQDEPAFFNWVDPQLDQIKTDFPVLSPAAAERMRATISQAKEEGDSLGGIIECAACGLPAGLGGPLFEGIEGKIAQIIYSIPAVKGIDFGAGFAGAYMKGSQHNDPFAIKDGKVITLSNNAGGILGGITNGMPLIFQVAIKPTPSIKKEQKTINLRTMQPAELSITGRHDPCIVPRAAAVVEAAAAIAIYDLILSGG